MNLNGGSALYVLLVVLAILAILWLLGVRFGVDAWIVLPELGGGS